MLVCIIWLGMWVLEIGIGVGLLVMMVVCVGVGYVYICEVDLLFVLVVIDIIVVNGLFDWIIVIMCYFLMFDVVIDLGGCVDLLVLEIIGDCLINEGVLVLYVYVVDMLLVFGVLVILLWGLICIVFVDLVGGD